MKVVSENQYDELECPGCKAKIKVEKEPPKHTIHFANTEIPEAELETKIDKAIEKRLPKKELEEPPKMEKSIEYPSWMPGEYCPDGNCSLGGVHPNKNYKRKAAKKCKNCDQFAPKVAQKCAWCGEGEFADMDDEDLENMGISLPHLEEHDHSHE